MKLNLTKYYFILLSGLLLIAGCGKLDNFDADDFSLFNNPKDKSKELRRYGVTPESNTPLVEYLVDPSSKESSSYEKDIRKMCDYAKLPYRSTKVSAFNASPVFAATTRSVCVPETSKLSQESLAKLVEFVAGGGTLFMPFATEDKRAAYLMGFKPNADLFTDITSKGFVFNNAILPNLKNQTYNDDGIHYGYAKENFRSGIKIWATANNASDFPLMVENQIGKGKVIFYNTTILFEKIERGLLFAGIIEGLNGIPYPIANTSTIFLDDFPSPLYNIKQEPIKSELNLTITDYVRKVWWPDMIKLAKKYNISYAAMIAFDYKNKTEPPFIFDQWDENKLRHNKKIEPVSDWLVKNVYQTGHELAFHGYNHVSLTRGNWKNQDFIVTALKSVQKKWEISNYGPLPTSYVPPSNIIDKNGLQLLKKGLPSLKYMCSLYLGEFEEGGDREFDFDPYQKDFFDYPRISDGFYLDHEKKLSQQSLYVYTGIWTHFVHPDDVYQIENPYSRSAGAYDLRNLRGLGWYKTNGKKIGLLSEFDDYLSTMVRLFPQMRFVNADQGGFIVNDWRASRFTHKAEDGLYTVEETHPEKSISNKQYWFVYSTAENQPRLESQLKQESVQYTKTELINGHLYMIFSNHSKLTVKDLKYKTQEQSREVATTVQMIRTDYKTYLENVKKFKAGAYEEIWVDDSEMKFKKELQDLKDKMLSDARIDPEVWNKYTTYMTWEDKGAEVWKMLDTHVQKYPKPENIMYSQALNKITEYPDEKTRERWLDAQLKIRPTDVAILKEYIEAFNTPENKDKIRTALENLLKVDNSSAARVLYIEHLIAYDRKAAVIELDKVAPGPDYVSVAADAAWLYADDKEYQKAYDWSLMTSDIDFASRMSWLIELKSYDVLEQEYQRHILANPDDYKAKAVMVGIYHEAGRFKDAWLLATSLPESPERTELQAMLNKDVIYVEEAVQQDLIDNHSAFFEPSVLAELQRNIRRQKGDFVSTDTRVDSNRDDPQAFKNIFSYNKFDKKGNLHGYSLTYSTMYRLRLPVEDKDNVTHAVGGLQYQFNNPVQFEKLQYWARGRVEYSDFQRLYFHLGGGLNYSKNKNYKSVELKIFPAETGAAYSKRIYRTQFNIYQDYYFLKYLSASISFEANYYNPSKKETALKTSDTYEGSLTARLMLDNGEEKRSRFVPFLEVSQSQGSLGKSDTDLGSGYPFWAIDERFYAGGGLGYMFGKSDSNFQTRVEAGWFYDDYSDEFQRYTGNVMYQILDYTSLTASFEFYVQSGFYSNSLQFGIKHNLKKRSKKAATKSP